MPAQRQTAHICRIADLLNGNYVLKQGWEPNYVETSYGNVSRSNIMAVVVSKESANSIKVDDGTGSITLRFFDNDKKISADIGDAVQIIGRPRMFNNEMFIVPEIIKKIENKKWIEHRRLELSLRKKIKDVLKQEAAPEAKAAEVKDAEANYFDAILAKIRELDKGSGANTSQVLKELNSKKAEQLINNLLEEGEIFEIKPGFVKVLE